MNMHSIILFIQIGTTIVKTRVFLYTKFKQQQHTLSMPLFWKSIFTGKRCS